MATPGVGEDIEDICTRCGDTWHVVMAKIGERVAKVVCKLCGSQHNYRGDKNAPAPSKGGASIRGAGRVEKRRVALWHGRFRTQSGRVRSNEAAARLFAQETYLPGERVIHATFGVGVVAAIPGPGKVDVQFTSGRAPWPVSRRSPRWSAPSQ
jgi:hypothetical protein